MAKVRIEYVRLRRGGDVSDDPDGGVLALVLGGGETLTVGGSSVQSAAVPDFGPDRGWTDAVHARVTALDRPVVIEWGVNPTADEAGGARVEPGAPVYVAVEPGHKIAAIAATHGVGQMARAGILTLQAEITRPANQTPYNAHDAVAGDAWLSSFDLSPIGGAGLLLAARLIRSTTSNSAVRFRAYVYDATLASPPADNAAFSLTYAERAKRRGWIDFTSPLSSAGASADCLEIPGVLSNGQGLPVAPVDGLARLGLVTLDGYTPAQNSDKFTLETDWVA